jgi:SAM-dependent methyltransferase
MPLFPFWKKKKPATNVDTNQSVAVLLNGRRYRQDVPYGLPKDLGEISRLDFQHYLIKQAIKVNYVAPLAAQSPRSILDVGCGTGIWLREMSAEFPRAQATGIDLEISSKSKEITPANCHFVQGNVLKGLPFANNTFSFVHQRFLASAIPADYWPQLLSELARVTEPGGWIELTEMLHRIEPMQESGKKISGWIEQFCAPRGIYPPIGEDLATLLQDEPALTEQQVYFHDLPVGEWGGPEGKSLAKSHLTAFEAIKPMYINDLNIDQREFNRVINTVGAEWDESHAHSRCYFALARKV